MGGRVHVTHTVHAHAWMHTFWRNGYHTWGREGGHSTQLLLGDSFSLCLWIPMYLSGVKLQCVGTDCTSGFLCLYLTINAFHYPPLFKTNSRSFCGFRRNDLKNTDHPQEGARNISHLRRPPSLNHVLLQFAGSTPVQTFVVYIV